MGHIHNVTDSDNHFTINAITRAIKNESSRKTTLIQHDHNSERFSFDLPRYIDGHDMLLCDVVQVHYINVDAATKEQHTGLYEVTDLKALAGAADTLTCSWLISNHATGLVGSLHFLLRFCCTEGGAVTYAWNTAICDAVSVSAGIDNGETVVQPYPDIIAEWRAELFEAGGDAAHNVQAAQAAALAAIEEAGLYIVSTGEHVRAGLVAVLANAVRGKLSGEIVTADDVSPIPAEMAVSVRGKNLSPTAQITVSGSHPWANKFTDDVIRLKKGKYTISCDYSQSGTTTWVCMSVRDSAAPTVQLLSESSKEASGRLKKSFEITEAERDIKIVFYSNLTAEIRDTECTFTNIQLEAGDAATEYTPYIPPETVTVRACGKNMIPKVENMPTTAGLTYTKHDDGSITIDGTAAAESILYIITSSAKIQGLSGTYTLSVGAVLPDGCMVVTEHYDGSAWKGSLGRIMPGASSAALRPEGSTHNLAVYLKIASGTAISRLHIFPQLEIGEAATEYEPYTGAKYPAAADGSVTGVLSVAPNMTLMTDTPGITIDCEYNRDTNKVIEKLVQAVEALGGSV